MTSPLTPGRLGYLNLPQPDIIEVHAHPFRTSQGNLRGAVHLGDVGMHVESAAAARTIAAAFAQLADQMEAAEATSQDDEALS